jgi:hypothetical protein
MAAWFRRRFGVSAVLAMLGAVVSAAGGLWAFVYENQSVGLPAIVVLIGALITASSTFWSSSERTEFERELRGRSDEIAALNRQIAASVTGGDSFCYVEFGSLGVAEPNTAILMLLHKGTYPMYEVGGYMVDLQEFSPAPDAGQEIRWSAFHNIDGGNMMPESAKPLMNWRLSDMDEQNYNVSLYARNGFFSQLIRLRCVNGNWKVATRVRKQLANGDESPTLYLDVDAGFPLNERGEVDWS